MASHLPRAALAAAVLLGLTATGCGAAKPAKAAVPTAVAECRSQWHDVAKSIAGLEEDTLPSALASRWTSVAATVDYYETTNTATKCQQNITNQLDAITALREFSARVRPYDMQYQTEQVEPFIHDYVADALPAPTKDKKGKPVPPPSKAAVSKAMETLIGNAVAANTELEPGWAQLASVELKDHDAVDSAVQDLAYLAKDGPHWAACNAALRVLATAIRAQQQLGPNDPLPTPTATPTPTPTSGATPTP